MSMIYQAPIAAIARFVPVISPSDEEGLHDILREAMNAWEAAKEICELLKLSKQTYRTRIEVALTAAGYC